MEDQDMSGALMSALGGGGAPDEAEAPISIDPESVKIDGTAPQPGDTFSAQVKLSVSGVGVDGQLQCSLVSVNDHPVGGADEGAEPEGY